jgi:hypothetical protein
MTISFPLWQLAVFAISLLVVGGILGFLYGTRYERVRRVFAVKTVVYEDGTRATEYLTSATSEEIAVLAYMDEFIDRQETEARQGHAK